MEGKAEKKQLIHQTYGFNLVLTLGYCTFIFIQSCYPTPETLPVFPFGDKVFHGLGYALLGILFYRTFKAAPNRMSVRMAILMAVFASTLYGISDEIHQHFVPARQADLMDGVVDAIGSMIGVVTYHYVLTKHRIRSIRGNS